MKQDDLKDLSGTWSLAAEFAARHQRLFKHFEAFSGDAATLEREGERSGSIEVASSATITTSRSPVERFAFVSRREPRRLAT
jgi:hypothetical protein